MKNIGKPCAGKLHARFDEGGQAHACSLLYPFEERCVARATAFDMGGVSLLTCSAEDLVVLKAFAARDRDWADIESIAVRQFRQLDWPLIFEEFAPLAELREESQATARLNVLKDKYSARLFIEINRN